MTHRALRVLPLIFLFGSLPARGEVSPSRHLMLSPSLHGCVYDAEEFQAAAEKPSPQPDASVQQRLLKYTEMAGSHRVAGLASYYSGFFDGRKTANGEIFRNGKFSAAHLTLPLGTWVEVKARANGRTMRLRINDRGPYAPKFFLDLSQAAARYLGVDVDRDRYVEIRIIALPGEQPLPEEIEVEMASAADVSGKR